MKKNEKPKKRVDGKPPPPVDLAMVVGAPSERVNVVAEVQAIQTESATLGRVVTTKEIQDTPLNGRNPLFLALLKPGVSGGALAQFSFDLSTGGLNTNGGRTQDKLITYSGPVRRRAPSNRTTIGTPDVA